jgi:7-cyano-7-deazaguanine synthase
MDVLILFSGGIDSTSCLNYFLKRNDNVTLVYFNYGQPNEQAERNSAINISEYYKQNLNIIDIKNCSAPQGMIPGRNAFLLSLSLMVIPFKSGGVVIGVHNHAVYPDCSASFIAIMQKIFDVYFDGQIRILTPFLYWDKSDIITYANSEKVPLELVYSTSVERKFYLEEDVNEKK